MIFVHFFCEWNNPYIKSTRTEDSASMSGEIWGDMGRYGEIYTSKKTKNEPNALPETKKQISSVRINSWKMIYFLWGRFGPAFRGKLLAVAT